MSCGSLSAKNRHFGYEQREDDTDIDEQHNKGHGEAELLTGAPLLIQQFKALFKKNFILAWRYRRATFLQLFSSLFFMFVMFCIDKATKASHSTSTLYSTIKDPKALVDPPIPPCEDKYFIKKPCFDFVWSGKTSPNVTSIVNNIMANNPGRPIPSNKVISFGTPDEVNEWFFNNAMRCPGALHFVERNAKVISYGIQTNSTTVNKRGHPEDPTLKFQIPLQLAAEREIARYLLGDLKFSWVVGLKEFAHPGEPAESAMRDLGPTFLLAMTMFGFVFQVGNLVGEKELKLRQAMTMMGLYETSYWLSWLIWETSTVLLTSLFTVVFGMIFKFDFFLRNSFVILFLTFFLFQLNMITFAFMISTFLEKSSAATSVGFSIFILSFMGQLASSSGFPYEMPNISKKYWLPWSFFPPNLLSEAINLLLEAADSTEGKGFTWSTRETCPPNIPYCRLTIGRIYQWLITTFFLWFILAIYFDNIFPNPAGLRKPLLYFLNPGYWTGRGGNSDEEGGLFSCIGSIPPLEEVPPDDDDDVREEEDTVKQQVPGGVDDPTIAVQIRGLIKAYPGTTTVGCCKIQKTPPFHAVKGLWVNFAKDQLFCLLGPNGAGKTTTISCLTGIAPVTSGDALIYGHSVKSSVGMANIRRIIGVCPQFDILWEVLSGHEHLHLFASIKGLPPSSIEPISTKSLEEVKLTDAAHRRAGMYSGGMKRRLSVAIALIGNPKLVILDEPTTGMDPITRRHVWDFIGEAKKGRSIVLTTHSMEEADILSDRIAILAKGRLRCIGTSIRLKSKFGTGFIANLSFPQNPFDADGADQIDVRHDVVKEFFRQRLNVEPKEETKAILTFIIPYEKEAQLTGFFQELQDRQKEFGLSDIQLGLTTLKEVFMNVVKKAE